MDDFSIVQLLLVILARPLPGGISSAVNACANALQWQHALRLLKKPPVPWHLRDITGCPAHKWLKQEKSIGLYFSCWPFIALATSTCKCFLSYVRAYSLVRYAKGGRKTLQETTDKHMQKPEVPRKIPTFHALLSGSKTFNIINIINIIQMILIICIHVPSFSIIFPPHLLLFSPLETPGFLQLQRQHQRLRALSALVPRPGSGEFPLRAAATAQRHHVGCHRGRHAAGPGTFGAPVQ